MSFTIIEQATPRLHRSELAVPGSNPGLFEKAAQSAADIIFSMSRTLSLPTTRSRPARTLCRPQRYQLGYKDHDGPHQWS